jgi:hypothetical protein
MPHARNVLLIALFCTTLGGCSGAKYEPPPDHRYTIDTGGQIFGEDEEWKEAEFSLPPYPQESDLLPFDILGQSHNTHFVDQKSISIGPDGVVRYTLVLKTPSGAENVTFEGMRCEEQRWKSYANGRRGTWVPARDAQWRPVARKSLEDYRYSLYRSYFCPDGLPRRETQDIIAEIKRQYQAGPMFERR